MVTEVPDVRLGHWTDREAGTGCTVVIPPPGTVGAIEVRGGGPATRDVDVLAPLASVQGPTALLLAGGSAFGLDAAGGVARWCEEQGLGHATGYADVPIVSTACIFDLGLTGNARRPGPEEGYAAAAAARTGPHEVGSVGAGTGATCGKLRARDGWCKGGLGTGVRRLHDGVTVAALAVVNAWGDVLDERGEVIAGAFERGVGFVGATGMVMARPPVHPRLAAGGNTTLACVVTDGRLTKVEAAIVARMAHDGLARAVSPVHTILDGDATFCLATGARPASAFAVGVAGAEAVAAAIRDAVRSATSVRGVPTGAERAASLPGGPDG